MSRSGKRYLAMMLPLLILSITACSSSSFTPRKGVLPPATGYLTEQDVLDIHPTQEVTEQDIQAAIKLAKTDILTLTPGAKIILVQSGATVPDSVMQEAMMAYYQVSVYSGIAPVKPLPKLPPKGEAPLALPEPNYIKSLRLAAAKARQDKIIVYWGNLELAQEDKQTKTLVWQRYLSGDIPSSTKQMRYLVHFAIVDVKTGMWAMYVAMNHQNNFVATLFKRQQSDINQIAYVKEQAYRLAAQSLAEHFSSAQISAAKKSTTP
ncbi:hypothetical protein RHO15_06490 [Utexia brackfieldae]|uniref:hypothetical protein n=1 Tax=Utexia brackfieldae TaxID=3074108 RepID=UPI00370DA09B